jgi:uncharacterized protein YdeI (YjbR/CyaY-like superfamily)
MQPKPTFFSSPADLRGWLKAHHGDTPELWFGFLKKTTGRAGLTYKEALDEALCYGWIDGVRKTIDAERYMIRFSPRKPDSFWSRVNTRRAEELIKLKKMAAPGRKAFERRDATRNSEYSYERETATLSPAEQKLFRANRKAWEFFQALPPYARRMSAWFVVSARRPETRQKRLLRLIGDSAAGRRLDGLGPKPARGG